MLDTVENNYQTISVKRFAPNLGAEIYGVDLSKDITDKQFAEILRAFHDHQVLFFKDQKEISPEMQVIFGKRFGKLHAHPAAPTMKQLRTQKLLMVSYGTLTCHVMRPHHLVRCFKYIFCHRVAAILCLVTCIPLLIPCRNRLKIFYLE